MKRTLIFAFAITLMVSASVFGQTSTVAAQQQQQQATTPSGGGTGTFNITAKPIYETSTKTVPTYGKSPKKPVRKPTGYTTQKVEKLTGWSVDGQFVVPPATPATNMQQQQQQIVNVGAINEDINGVKLRVTALEEFDERQTEINRSLANGINAVDGKVNVLNANFQQYVVGNEKNIQSLDRRLTNEENKPDRTTGVMDWINLGLNVVNTGINIHQYKQISDLKKQRSTNNGNQGNNCWKNGRYVCGVNPCNWMDQKRPCYYNPPVGGNCNQRGNCNYNNGGPVSVANCPPGAPASYCTGGGQYNNAVTTTSNSSFSNLIFGSGSSSGTYVAPRNSGGTGSGLYNTSSGGQSGRRY